MFAYRVQKISGTPFYVAQYKRGKKSTWTTYKDGRTFTQSHAYSILEKHANPVELSVKLIGMAK